MSLLTQPSEQLTVRAGGRVFGGWTGVSVSASLETVARTFSLTAAARWPQESHLLRLRPGSEVSVYIGADKVITGWLDKVEGSFSKDSHTLSITGRSKTSDLVDCDPTGVTSFRRKDALAITRALAASYSVDVVQAGSWDITSKLRRFAVNDQEKAAAAIQRLGELGAFLVTDDAQGRLVLWREAYQYASVALQVGVNILAGTVSVDVSQRFSTYQVRSYRQGDDEDFGDVLQASEEATDSGDLGRERLLKLPIEKGEDKARTRQRAQWEASTRYGQSIQAKYTVQGWRQTPGGALWKPGLLVTVEDSFNGVYGEFLVVDVDLTLDGSGGSIVQMTLAPPEGYELLPPMKPRKRRGKRKPVKSAFSALAFGVQLPSKEDTQQGGQQ